MSTRPCPNCGHIVSAQARFCGQCGKTIDAPEPSKGPPPAAKTLMQTVNDAHAEARAKAMLDEAIENEKKKPAASLGKTMLLGGDAAHAVHAAPAPAAPAPAPANRTVLGMPARNLPAPQPAQPETPVQLPPALKTMMGVAIPGIAPTHEPHEPQHVPDNRPQGTLLGVAIPGIAPTHAAPQESHEPHGIPRTHGTNIGFPSPLTPPPPIVPPPRPLVAEPLPQAPRLPEKRGVPAIVVVLIVILLVAIAGGVAAAFVLRGGAPLAASPQLDESGRESLKITCKSCPDGTVVALGASSVQITGGEAVLPLPAPLSIGENDLEVKIDRPASGRDETVKVHVPVAYRVRADMATLSAKPPAITVRVEATPGSEVSVEGSPVALDATGRGSYAIDLSKEVEGTSDEQKTFERKIAFSITSPGGKAEAGQLTARAAIVPLHLDAPGLVLYTDRPTAAVSGQTKPGGTVQVDGAPAPIDAQGRFGARVDLAQPGEKTLEIVASAPPLAPRVVHAKVIRAASIEDAARELEAKGALRYADFASDPNAKAGEAVFVEGDVIEARAQQGYSVLLVDAKGCAGGKGTCLVRLVHGQELKVSRGEAVRAYGSLQGTVAASGRTVPDVEASLVIAKAGAKK